MADAWRACGRPPPGAPRFLLGRRFLGRLPFFLGRPPFFLGRDWKVRGGLKSLTPARLSFARDAGLRTSHFSLRRIRGPRVVALQRVAISLVRASGRFDVIPPRGNTPRGDVDLSSPRRPGDLLPRVARHAEKAPPPIAIVAIRARETPENPNPGTLSSWVLSVA